MTKYKIMAFNENKGAPHVIYIACQENWGKVLEFDASTGNINIVDRPEGVKDADTAHGRFTQEGGHLIGLIPTEKGPTLLIDDKRYLLKEDRIHLMFGNKPEGSMNTFKIMSNGTIIHELEYWRSIPNADYFEDSEMVDFFYWLSRGYQKQAFIDAHTLKPK